ncbi:hypothetical protein GCM10020256_72520 [Streptomyces thermocoprophilus]
MDGGLRGARVRGAVGDAAQDGVLGVRGRGFLSAEHPVEEVDADEVGEPGDDQVDEFLGGADHVEGGADGGRGLVEQGQPPPGAVLAGAVEGGEGHADDVVGGVADRPHLDVPGVLADAGRGADGVLAPYGESRSR